MNRDLDENNDDNDPFEEDIVFDQAGLLGGKSTKDRQLPSVGFLPTFMLLVRTVFLCTAFVSLGLCAAVSTSPLIKLELEIGSSDTVVFHTFTAHAIGMLIGGILGSLLLDIYNRQFLIFVSLIWVAISVAVLPFTITSSIWITLSIVVSLGAGLGFIFTGGNVLCLDLWGRHGGASLQAVHFSFAVGAFVAPLVIHPFFVGPFPAEFNFKTNESAVNDTVSIVRYKREFGQLHINNIKELTMPLFNDSLNANEQSLQYLEHSSEFHQSEVMPVNGSDSSFVVKPVEENFNISRIKIPKPKPSFTDANHLHDEDSKWSRPPLKGKNEMASKSTTNKSVDILSVDSKNDTNFNNSINKMLNKSSSSFPFNNIDNSMKMDAVTVKSDVPTITRTDRPEIDKAETNSLKNIGTENMVLSNIDMGTSTVQSAIPGIAKTDKPISTKVAKVETSFPKNVESNMFMLSHIVSSDLERIVGKTDTANMNVPEPEVMSLEEIPEEQEEIFTEKPFASKKKSQVINSIIHFLKPETYGNFSENKNVFVENMANKFRNYGVTKIHLAYIFIGIFVLINALISLVILCHNPREPRSKQELGCVMQKGKLLVFTLLLSAFMFSSEALVGAVGQLCASSDVNYGLHILKNGIDGLVLFWGLISGVRFLCVILFGCRIIKPAKLLASASVCTIVGCVFLSIGSYNKDDFLWAGILTLPFGLAPILPTCFLWMAEHMRVSHRCCALMVVFSAFGNTLTHAGLTQVSGNTHLYSYILVLISVLALIILFIAICVVMGSAHAHDMGIPSGYHLASQHEDDDVIEMDISKSFQNDTKVNIRQVDHFSNNHHEVLID